MQIKIKLLGVSKPPVWRRLQLRADTRLDHLHDIIVAAFGWENYHVHEFTSGPEEFGEPSHEQHQEMLDRLGLDNSSAFDPNDVTVDQIEEEVALNGASR